MRHYIAYMQRFLAKQGPTIKVGSILKANRSYIAAHVALADTEIVV